MLSQAAIDAQATRLKNFNANKTHCPRGHEYTPDNTFYRSLDGSRYCKTCKSLQNHARYLRKKGRSDAHIQQALQRDR